MHIEQRSQTLDLLKSRHLDCALFAHPNTVTWLTGFAAPIGMGTHPFSGGPAFVWVEGDTFTLVVQDVYAALTETFAQQANCRVVAYEGYTIHKPISHTLPLVRDTLLELVGMPAHGTPVGVETSAIPSSWYESLVGERGLDLHSLDGVLTPLRRVKTAEELAILRRVFAITDEAHAAARAACQVGKTEIEVWSAIQASINASAGMPLPLGNDCVVGYRAPNNIGGAPATNSIRHDTALIVDISTIVEGYWSDSCATYYPHQPTPRQQSLHKIVEEALDYTISLVKPGVIAREIDQKVRGFMEGRGLPVYPHHTGHGIGIAGHEAPRLVPYNEETLQVGEVIMVEPGIYFPGETSVRLEHALLITPDGAEILTKHL
jgi:Xaa-Pro aminopeptidase